MKIKTITCHDCYNFGASLQAYALEHYLESQGHDVEIIHYKPDYLSGHFKLTAVNNTKFNRPILKQLYLLAKLPGRLSGLKRKKAFDNFTDKYLKLTRRYNSFDELKENPPSADCYIAGSDQIWNTLFKNGRDAAFYLDFGNEGTKRISYAASFATADVVPEFRQFVCDKLKNFNSVSIRESNSLPLLKSLGRNDGVVVCDPVMLPERSQWVELMSQNPLNPKYEADISRPYILLYLSDNSKAIENTVKELKQKTGWKIYAVGAVKAAYADRNFTDASPVDFLHLIANSQFVASNSFHATVFSLIFEKKFCVVNRIEGINERMKSLLENFGLGDRLVSSCNPGLLSDIDFEEVRRRMDSMAAFSKNWLNSQLEQ